MSRPAISRSVFLALLLLGCPAIAYAQTVSVVNPGTTMTSGIVGITSTQTARLNVVNLQQVIPGIAAVACPATLEFYDEAGNQLKQFAVANISPSTGATFAFKPVMTTSASPVNRFQLRAVVATAPLNILNPLSNTNAIAVMPSLLGCNLMASLEISDDATGVTHIITTDFRMMTYYSAMPMASPFAR